MLAKQIVPGLYVIPVGPVNTFLLDSPDGCALIDTGVPNSADKILQAVRELGKQPGDIRHLLLTHAHPDHIGNFAAIKKATGARAYAHALDTPAIASGASIRPMTPAPGAMSGLLFRLFVRPMGPIETAPIDQEVQDGEMLPIAGGLTALHLPGHCAGQLAFLWPQHGGIVFAADACANVAGLALSIGYEDLEEGKRSLRKLAQQEFQNACFGHGKSILRDASARFRAKWG